MMMEESTDAWRGSKNFDRETSLLTVSFSGWSIGDDFTHRGVVFSPGLMLLVALSSGGCCLLEGGTKFRQVLFEHVAGSGLDGDYTAQYFFLRKNEHERSVNSFSVQHV